MSSINDLLSQVTDIALRAKLEAEINKLTKHKKFGLVFEDHLPERTLLFDIPVKKNSRVALKNSKTSEVFHVLSVEDGVAQCHKSDAQTIEAIPVADLVPVAEFGEPIYPYLKPLDNVCNGDANGLWHTLIEADNYHALQLLEYLYAGKVDCIYIDPPYNTGAKDWKYNNDYVDDNDAYRHSKWLSMMQKRLKLAKKLLNPKDSVLICAIDENELHHLSILLHQIFPGNKIQMVSVLINPAGASIIDQFSRVDEQLLFVQIGSAQPERTIADTTPGISTVLKKDGTAKTFTWESLLRSGGNSRRQDTKAKFFPIFIDETNKRIVGCGDHLPLGLPIQESPLKPEGCIQVWPIKTDGSEACWQLSAPTFRKYMSEGRIKLGTFNKRTKRWGISFLTTGHMNAIARGELQVDGKDENGSLIVKNVEGKHLTQKGKTIWTNTKYSATEYGSTFLRSFLPGRKFPFPKSIYAVEDSLRYYVQSKPNALIVDFFAGSGTTMHAVNLLNLKDGGNRRCIMVTNNEVSDDECKALSQRGFKPGDAEWESLGIARYVTWPRILSSITGVDLNGKLIEGVYKECEKPFSEGFKANAAFFKLGFLDKTSVALGRQFKELLPVLWMKSGCYGPCPSLSEELPEMLVLPQNRMAVLLVESAFGAFKDALENHPNIQSVYLVTDYEGSYQAMSKQLNVSETYQLYRDYLDNFRINHSRG